MSLLSMLKGNGPSGFGYGTTAEQATAGIDLSGKTILVTGCNSGLGLETLRVLGMRGAYIIAVARTRDKAAAALAAASCDGTPLACELSEPASVRACIEQTIKLQRPIDVLLCNAGIMALPKLETRQGFELQFLTNHIGHFILVTGLLEQLTPDARVVMLSSTAHTKARPEGIEFDNLDGKRSYSPWSAYGQSKLSNLLFAKHLATKLPHPGQTANSVHPGVIATNLTRHMPGVIGPLMQIGTALVLKTIPQGAATQCYVAVHPDAGKTSGEYFADCNVARTSAAGADAAMAEQLWTVTTDIAARL